MVTSRFFSNLSGFRLYGNMGEQGEMSHLYDTPCFETVIIEQTYFAFNHFPQGSSGLHWLCACCL